MKKQTITCLALAMTLVASSCRSSQQAAGGLTGVLIGGEVGRTVGILAGHGPFRGESAALGNLIGMGVGAVLGVGIAAQTEKNERIASQHERDFEQDYPNAYQGPRRESMPPRNGNYKIGDNSYGYSSYTNTANVVKISELSYMDTDGDGFISRNEVIEVECYVTNTTNSTLNDIDIYLDVNDSKAFVTSPLLTTTLQPGQRIRYTGRLLCNKTRGKQAANISLCVRYADKNYASEILSIKTR